MIKVIDKTGCSTRTTEKEWFFLNKEKTPPCSGLATIARRECANFGIICKNCRLCNHRRMRCDYFERAVLPGLSIKDAERYASGLDVALEKRGLSRRKVASWDRLESRTAS